MKSLVFFLFLGLTKSLVSAQGLYPRSMDQEVAGSGKLRSHEHLMHLIHKYGWGGYGYGSGYGGGYGGGGGYGSAGGYGNTGGGQGGYGGQRAGFGKGKHKGGHIGGYGGYGGQHGGFKKHKGGHRPDNSGYGGSGGYSGHGAGGGGGGYGGYGGHHISFRGKGKKGKHKGGFGCTCYQNQRPHNEGYRGQGGQIGPGGFGVNGNTEGSVGSSGANVPGTSTEKPYGNDEKKETAGGHPGYQKR